MRKMRRIKIMVLLFLVALGVNIKVKAAQATWEHSGDWMYYVENGYAVIGRYEGTETEVIIPEKLGEYTVKKLRWYVFGHTKVTSVTISSTVEEIDAHAFSAGTDYEHVLQEGYIHTINVDGANKNYTSINGILFSKDKKTLEVYPEGKEAESYEILPGVETIRGSAFENNRYIKSIIFPSTVKTVGKYAFSECTNLEEVSLNDGLVEMESGLFNSCKKLRTITIPKTVEDMYTSNPMCFNAVQLEAINVHPQNKFYSSIDGVLFDKAQETMYEYPEGKTATSYTIPPTVKTVHRMSGNKHLKELIFPPSVKIIGDNALMYATSLKKVEMENCVERIGARAFLGCRSLETITIPTSLLFLGESAFAECGNLENIIFEARNCVFFQSNNVIPKNTVIYGYANSTAHRYAENYGRAFTDIETNEKIEYEYDANRLIELLPISNDLTYGEPAYPSISYRDENGNFAGYQPSIIHEYNILREEYIELKRFTDDLVKDCTTDKQKIDTISQWVHEHVAYRLGSMSGNSIESVYMIFQRLYGNCMCFTQLTNYMLYLEGIPVGSIIIPGHEMGVAFDGETWYVVDSTNGYIGTSIYEDSVVESIIFSAGQLTFDIRSTEGVYLAAVGYDQKDAKSIHNITIPSYVKGIYETVLSGLPKDVVVKGARGGQVEEYCKKKYKYITYSGSQFSATNIGEDETKTEESDASVTEDDETKAEEIDAFVTIEAEAMEGGIVFGKGKSSKGERVELTSLALDDTWSFSGWYVGDRLVSSNKKYRFTASENVKIKAVFEKRLSRQKGYRIVMSKEYSDSYVSIYQGVNGKCYIFIKTQLGHMVSSLDYVTIKCYAAKEEDSYSIYTVVESAVLDGEAGFLTVHGIDKAKFSKFRKVELYDKRNVLVASISARRGENNGTSMGQTVKVGRLKYKVSKVRADGTGEVALTGTAGKKDANKLTTLKTGDTVKINKKNFKVTAVGKNAFKNCKRLKRVTIGKNVTSIGAKAFSGCKALKKITIKSTKLKKVGKNAFKGIHAKAVIKAPKVKLKAYKKLLKKKGQAKGVRIVK